jgi:hypothetical protein
MAIRDFACGIFTSLASNRRTKYRSVARDDGDYHINHARVTDEYSMDGMGNGWSFWCFFVTSSH